MIGLCALSARANNRFLRLAVQDGNAYWATIQSTDGKAGFITLVNGESHANWQEEFLINKIRFLDYLIPLKRWGTQIIIRVYKKEPNNTNGVTSNNQQPVINQANLIQDDGDGWVVKLENIKGALGAPIITIPDSGSDLNVRVMITKDGRIRLLTT